ncbi:Mis6 domain protein [Xylona heveae TC161]|uniref:Mis6 domain protein n=1 Tax=Xylona heveae (strain CBS 132557 / TC161) TaxID=1328760 RepID=A0A165FT58_XYLHT|nr:Mis6 domain protein [Xylona heveae TC161]KZF21343.1 Mis6 domain protein [Xylona heveae TC161]
MPSAVLPDSRWSALATALQDIENASRNPKNRRTDTVPLVDAFTNGAFEYGVPAELLERAVNVVSQANQLDQASIARIIKSLYPMENIPAHIIIKVVGCLGQGRNKPSLPTQALLLRWLILVYETLDQPSVLSRLYGVLFGFLDMLSLRAPLCHILSIITRRKHVKPYRVQTLLELCQSFGNEPHIIGLIRIYKEFYPDIIINDASKGRGSYFAHPDPEWRDHLRLIQENHAQRDSAFDRQPSGFRVKRVGPRRHKDLAVPEVHTSKVKEGSFSLEEIDSVEDFIGKLEKIELPNQMVSAIDDHLLQKFLVLRPSETAFKRLEFWLAHCFEEEMYQPWGSPIESGTLSLLLSNLVRYVQYNKSIPASALSFLQFYLPKWNGTSNLDAVLELLAFLPPQEFEDLRTFYLNHVERALLSQGIHGITTLLGFYSALLRQWTVKIVTEDGTSGSAINTSHSKAFESLSQHVDLLIVSLLSNGSPSTVLSLAILSFEETIADALTYTIEHPGIRITIPSSHVVYSLFFTSSLSTISRLSHVLASYKLAFEACMTHISPQGEGESNAPWLTYPREYINHFNGYLMDICNCLWRNRAFNQDDPNALGCLMPTSALPVLRRYADTVGLALPVIFGLSHSSTLCRLSIASFREMEDHASEEQDGLTVRHAGPVTQRTLTTLSEDGGLRTTWTEYRLEVLKWLDERGVTGITRLMSNTMKHLMKARAG